MATQMQLLVNMIAASFGTGILSMPWSTAGASLIPALVVVFLVTVLMVFTISLLAQAAETHQKADIGSLLALLPGRAGWILPTFINIALWSTLWLTLVGYVVTIADALHIFFPAHRTAVGILGSVVILPLCFLDMSRLAVTSSFSVLATLNLAAIIGHTLFEKSNTSALPNDLCWFGFGDGLIAMASVTCTCMIVQLCTLQMYAELDDRTPQKFNRITRHCFVVLFFAYAGFSAMGYLTFGNSADANILKSLPEGAWGKASRISFVLVLVAAYPIFVYPMISTIRNSETLRDRGVNITLWSGVATVFVVASAAVAASLMDNLAFINALLGAVQCAIFVGICPGLAGMYLLGQKSDTLRWKLAMVALMITCCVLGVVGVKYTDNYTQDLHSSCRWRSTDSSMQERVQSTLVADM